MDVGSSQPVMQGIANKRSCLKGIKAKHRMGK